MQERLVELREVVRTACTARDEAQYELNQKLAAEQKLFIEAAHMQAKIAELEAVKREWTLSRHLQEFAYITDGADEHSLSTSQRRSTGVMTPQAVMEQLRHRQGAAHDSEGTDRMSPQAPATLAAAPTSTPSPKAAVNAPAVVKLPSVLAAKAGGRSFRRPCATETRATSALNVPLQDAHVQTDAVRVTHADAEFSERACSPVRLQYGTNVSVSASMDCMRCYVARREVTKLQLLVKTVTAQSAASQPPKEGASSPPVAHRRHDARSPGAAAIVPVLPAATALSMPPSLKSALADVTARVAAAPPRRWLYRDVWWASFIPGPQEVAEWQLLSELLTAKEAIFVWPLVDAKPPKPEGSGAVAHIAAFRQCDVACGFVLDAINAGLVLAASTAPGIGGYLSSTQADLTGPGPNAAWTGLEHASALAYQAARPACVLGVTAAVAEQLADTLGREDHLDLTVSELGATSRFLHHRDLGDIENEYRLAARDVTFRPVIFTGRQPIDGALARRPRAPAQPSPNPTVTQIHERMLTRGSGSIVAVDISGMTIEAELEVARCMLEVAADTTMLAPTCAPLLGSTWEGARRTRVLFDDIHSAVSVTLAIWSDRSPHSATENPSGRIAALISVVRAEDFNVEWGEGELCADINSADHPISTWRNIQDRPESLTWDAIGVGADNENRAPRDFGFWIAGDALRAWQASSKADADWLVKTSALVNVRRDTPDGSERHTLFYVHNGNTAESAHRSFCGKLSMAALVGTGPAMTRRPPLGHALWSVGVLLTANNTEGLEVITHAAAMAAGASTTAEPCRLLRLTQPSQTSVAPSTLRVTLSLRSGSVLSHRGGGRGSAAVTAAYVILSSTQRDAVRAATCVAMAVAGAAPPASRTGFRIVVGGSPFAHRLENIGLDTDSEGSFTGPHATELLGALTSASMADDSVAVIGGLPKGVNAVIAQATSCASLIASRTALPAYMAACMERARPYLRIPDVSPSNSLTALHTALHLDRPPEAVYSVGQAPPPPVGKVVFPTLRSFTPCPQADAYVVVIAYPPEQQHAHLAALLRAAKSDDLHVHECSRAGRTVIVCKDDNTALQLLHKSSSRRICWSRFVLLKLPRQRVFAATDVGPGSVADELLLAEEWLRRVPDAEGLLVGHRDEMDAVDAAVWSQGETGAAAMVSFRYLPAAVIPPSPPERSEAVSISTWPELQECRRRSMPPPSVLRLIDEGNACVCSVLFTAERWAIAVSSLLKHVYERAADVFVCPDVGTGPVSPEGTRTVSVNIVHAVDQGEALLRYLSAVDGCVAVVRPIRSAAVPAWRLDYRRPLLDHWLFRAMRTPSIAAALVPHLIASVQQVAIALEVVPPAADRGRILGVMPEGIVVLPTASATPDTAQHFPLGQYDARPPSVGGECVAVALATENYAVLDVACRALFNAIVSGLARQHGGASGCGDQSPRLVYLFSCAADAVRFALGAADACVTAPWCESCCAAFRPSADHGDESSISVCDGPALRAFIAPFCVDARMHGDSCEVPLVEYAMACRRHGFPGLVTLATALHTPEIDTVLAEGNRTMTTSFGVATLRGREVALSVVHYHDQSPPALGGVESPLAAADATTLENGVDTDATAVTIPAMIGSYDDAWVVAVAGMDIARLRGLAQALGVECCVPQQHEQLLVVATATAAGMAVLAACALSMPTATVFVARGKVSIANTLARRLAWTTHNHGWYGQSFEATGETVHRLVTAMSVVQPHHQAGRRLFVEASCAFDVLRSVQTITVDCLPPLVSAGQIPLPLPWTTPMAVVASVRPCDMPSAASAPAAKPSIVYPCTIKATAALGFAMLPPAPPLWARFPLGTDVLALLVVSPRGALRAHRLPSSLYAVSSAVSQALWTAAFLVERPDALADDVSTMRLLDPDARFVLLGAHMAMDTFDGAPRLTSDGWLAAMQLMMMICAASPADPVLFATGATVRHAAYANAIAATLERLHLEPEVLSDGAWSASTTTQQRERARVPYDQLQRSLTTLAAQLRMPSPAEARADGSQTPVVLMVQFQQGEEAESRQLLADATWFILHGAARMGTVLRVATADTGTVTVSTHFAEMPAAEAVAATVRLVASSTQMRTRVYIMGAAEWNDTTEFRQPPSAVDAPLVVVGLSAALSSEASTLLLPAEDTRAVQGDTAIVIASANETESGTSMLADKAATPLGRGSLTVDAASPTDSLRVSPRHTGLVSANPQRTPDGIYPFQRSAQFVCTHAQCYVW
jgi:hypothetical protein